MSTMMFDREDDGGLAEQVELQRPLPGEGLTVAPGGLPYERPAAYVDPEEILGRVFNILTQPKTAARFLGLMKAKIPIDVIVPPLCVSLAREGAVPVTVVPLIAPSITVMLYRMCEAAKIEPRLSSDSDAIDVDETDLALAVMIGRQERVDAAIKANQQSRELTTLSKSDRGMGLLQRPERMI